MLLSTRIIFLLLLLVSVVAPCSLYAAPDQYPGDTSIYGASTEMLKPNILIILDNSGSMSGTVCAATGPYVSTTTYPNKGYTSYKVYKVVSGSYSSYISNVSNVTTSCGGLNPRNLLLTTGQYSGRGLKSTGSCDGSSTSGVYVTGNYINYLKGGGCSVYKTKIDIAKEVVANLIENTNGVNFGIMKFNTDDGGTFISKSVSGSNYISTIKDMDAIHTGTTTNRAALLSIVSSYTASTWTPLAETLYEAMLYYKGGVRKFGSVGFDAISYKYTSPITASCQKNYVILVTDGMSTQDKDTILGTVIGDFDGDGKDPGTFADYGSHYLDDVAKYLYDTDMFPDATNPTMLGTQNVTTYTIGFGLAGADPTAVALLDRAADSNHGHGQAFLAEDQTGLTEALMNVVSNILEINSSFVAPIIPTSPENKTSDASRVYIGLFKPNNTSSWEGNLKKFGLDSYNDLCDKSDLDPATNPKRCLNYATYMDVANNTTKLPPADGKDDRDGVALPMGKTNGAFRDAAISFWSENADAGNVTAGGAGALLQASNPADRRIFTYLGDANLSEATNRFAISNTLITSALLGVVDSAARDNLVNFVVGYDAYDDNNNGITADNRDWILGDILHSRPAVVNYKKYTFSTTNESDCSINKTMIFVGANDGMLHAFRDCDGSEAWAFIPPDTLPNLQLMHSGVHTNFLDSSVSAYVYDAPVADGLANTVYLMVGQRRGGGGTVSPAQGSYYLLDASDPENPKFVKRISNATSGFAELGETWSEPKLAKIKVGTEYKIAAIFGGGYDNLNEDRRYGAATAYPATTASVSNTDLGAGLVSSTETTTALNPKGRGIYVVEIARLVAGASGYTSDFTNIGSLIWSYVSGSAASFVGEISVVDVKNRGYVDRLYAVDVAGTLWRFNIGASPSTTDTATWSGLKVFTANTSTDKGKKVFYKPSIVRDYCYTSAAYPTCYASETCDMVFYGTGDREHPLNKNVVDRIYMVKVKDSETAGNMTEANLVDVTTNQLQTTTTLNVPVANSCTKTSGSVDDYLRQLKLSSGWYIKLNELAGEKVLATSAVINKVAYFTTYVPTNSDPCQTTNPGDSYVYALRYNTGEAILNLNTTNDVASSTTNTRSQSTGATVLLNRSDRKKGVGQGIASGVVITTSSTGQVSVFVGAGDKPLTNPGITKSGTKPVKMLNWRLR